MVNSIPILQVRGDNYCVYYEPMFQRKYANTLAHRIHMQEVQKTQYSGGMTAGTRKRIAKAVTIMAQAAKPKWVFNKYIQQYQYHHLSFVTLTVSSRKNITTKFAYVHLLKPFLAWMRDTKGVKAYVWKLEFQERGQVHYHLTIPDFLDLEEIRKTWNSLQRKAGLLDEYAMEHKHFNPNSTDVHAVHNKKNIANYIVKELGKAVDAKRLRATGMVNSLIQAGEIPAEEKEKFIAEYIGEELKADGKVWDCSNNLAGADYFALPMERHHMDVFDALRSAGQLREVVQDWWSLLYINSNSPPDILTRSEQTQLDSYLQTILN